MNRPKYLPEFSNPPLDEVVLGLQFAPVPAYASVNSMKVWELFKSEFPKIKEQPIIDTQFETFGGSNIVFGAKFHVGAPPIGSRLWFMSDDENNLLQFQSDRLITNWRRQTNPRPYPRFDGISMDFERNLKKLAEHFNVDFGYQIDINQAEVSYINIIPVDEFTQIGDWLNIWNGSRLNIEGLNTSFSEVITDDADKPFARLKYEIQTVFTVDGKGKAIRLSLSYKGKPAGNDIESGMEFLVSGRDAVVTRFGEITTEDAHRKWGIIE